MYSIIIPYRNRETHLSALLPRLHQKFEGKEYEIIIAEMDEEGPFRKTVLMNTAAKLAKYERLVFHDVDYFPGDDVSYDLPQHGVAYYPVKRVIFLDENRYESPLCDIPAGYRNFRYDVGDHSGGVVIVEKSTFFDVVNGFNPDYIGWGKEDDDFLRRFDLHGITRLRGDGTFYGLHHTDNAPPAKDDNFRHNCALFENLLDTFWMGPANTNCDVTEFATDVSNVRWVKMKNCRTDVKLISVVLPTRHRPRSLLRTLTAFSNTVSNKSNIEMILHIDDDDTETIEFMKTVDIGIDIRLHITKRHDDGYAGLISYVNEMSKIVKGKMILLYGDDCIPSPFGWDEIAKPFADGFGVVDTKDNEGNTFNVVWFTTIKLFRIMKSFGTHPYLDRWMNDVKMSLGLWLADIPMFTEHIKDNPTSRELEPDRKIIHAHLNDQEMSTWRSIINSIVTYKQLRGLS